MRAAFKALPVTPERDGILGALGRLAKASLKRKIRYRATHITSICPENWFPALEFVIDQAVDCRNFYVHGGDAKIDYEQEFELLVFFTETLEFVFAASDLIEAGWDITRWYNGTKSTHAFGRYCHSYHEALKHLRSVLERRKSTVSELETAVEPRKMN